MADRDQRYYSRIHWLQQQAEKGNQVAIEALVRQSNSLQEQANRRLRSLESKGMTRWAYKNAQNWISTSFDTDKIRFKRVNTKTEPKAIALQMYAMNRFMNYQTSTVRGQRAVERFQYERFVTSTKFGEHNPFKNQPKEQVQEFLRFLGSSDDIRNLLQYGQSGVLPGDAGARFGSGNIVDILYGSFTEFSGRTDKILEAFSLFQNFQNDVPGALEIGFIEMLDMIENNLTAEQAIAKSRAKR